MAILKKIFIYPIKGLSGESLNEILLEKDQVLSGDREYAFARSHVSFDEKNPVYLRKTNFLALVKDEKLAKLSTEFNSKSKRLIIKVDKKTVLDEIIANEVNINKVEVFFQKYLNLGSNNKPKLVQGTKYENLLSNVDKSSFTSIREIPNWGDIFSQNVFFATLKSKSEKKAFCGVVDQYLSILVKLTKGTKPEFNDEIIQERIDYQKNYCVQQMKNEKTSMVLLKYFDEKWVNNYIKTVLFDF